MESCKMIKALLLKEAGYNEALLGFGLAMKPRSAEISDWWTREKENKVARTFEANAGRCNGHDKGLRMIQTWWHLDMPRFLSQEFATYKVGTTSSSASTMHRGVYEPVTIDCFDTTGFDSSDTLAMDFIIERMNFAIEDKDLVKFKKLLPESYMLEQIWNANYAVLNAIIAQRHNHRLEGWQELIVAFRTQVAHPELLIGPKVYD